MRARTFAALMVALLFALPAAAQEQRGSIEGVVRDSSGAVLPGVTVEARTNTGVVLTSTSDSEGTYRFPSVAPGTYEVTATLQGFAPKKQGNVDVGLGQIKKVDLALGLQGVAENVQVTAESPLVDVKQSARQTNISREQIALLPKGRDFTSLVTQAPGANAESKLGGLSIDGASAGENRYIIDGIETTNLQSGISGKNVIADFVEEVQVKSSGYTAEFGGATGGVINVITKSGTNNFHGNVGLQLPGQQPLRRSVAGCRADDDQHRRAEPAHRPGRLLQGRVRHLPEGSGKPVRARLRSRRPVVSNRAWFFGAYQPALTKTTREVNPTTAQNPKAGTFDISRNQQVQYATANVTSQLSDSLRGRIAYNNSWSRTKGLLPSLDGTDRSDTNYGKTSTFPNYSVSGNMDWVAVAAAVLRRPRRLLHVGSARQQRDRAAALPLQHHEQRRLPRRARLSCSTRPGFTSIPSNTQVMRDQQTRGFFQADGTFYVKAAGDHQFKFGVQADRVGNDVLSGESRNRA